MRVPALVAALLAVSCASPGDDAPNTCGESQADPRQTWVMTSLVFAPVVDGVSDGFNLDDRVSAPGDPAACNTGDYVGLSGEPGIDNAFGALLPALNNTEFVGVEPLVQDTINAGSLLLLFDVAGFDGASDDCVQLSLMRGVAEPFVGHDSRIQAHQTFPIDEAFAPISAIGSVDGGVVEVRGLEVNLPLQVFEANLVFSLFDAGIRFTIDESGEAYGVISGALDIDALVTVARTENVDPTLAAVLEALLYSVADLEPDALGVCQRISAALQFTARPAYIYGFEGYSP